MPIFKFINDAGIVGWVIVTVGFAAFALTLERIYTLYHKYGMNFDAFALKIQNLISQKRHEEALAICHELKDKPLAQAFKTIIEKADQTEDTIFQAHDIALAETIPLVTKRLHHISMTANVATLLGLLGTIHGLILSFAAVAQADPSQKQVLLANGISVAMYTTALGLIVAIPLMVAYSFLVSRQNEIVGKIQEKTGKLTEQLTSYDLISWQGGSSVTVNQNKTPPPLAQKVS
ncbi:MAG: MotA/TolQ/ExbB proton channel family protein [Bdellovibrionaceae bacterium]|nr:MotA/TolQ/ExbB proton channel family protein [Pseudobdellovibrionaceae bacterium]MDW8189797.1 MotA/TolQ/ExbB proton channel family protein [Pseudobdellovibrionaceae bacterium]